ncbi:MAG: tRNA (5-methylaminomethyl-2-thiouridine)(34)-methyltransferase MnmD [Schleiferiaceae bacterium]|jgi:tRNA U34 5-methylaminomethyl-2-thiouridine-forming methyltransferase MnmC|nr:tRNA (5-methylaminomethyl-2-thiouridine)(34)-methyltransferase MnmD [Schleiferiaceae bacterium]
MKRELRETADGSKTLFIEELDEHYHSIHGALAESRHVFIEAGLKFIDKDEIHILEIGFGTGLNLLTTLEANETLKKRIFYTGVEAYPVLTEEVNKLSYENLDIPELVQSLIPEIHDALWEKNHAITTLLSLKKEEKKFQEIRNQNEFDLIYFDAFAPSAQPELWTEDVFKNMFKALKPSGALVTYCAKGQVKRNMKAVGFEIERLPGPPGKREMTRAIKA